MDIRMVGKAQANDIAQRRIQDRLDALNLGSEAKKELRVVLRILQGEKVV